MSTLSREHIIWAYRLLLDREPENNAIITEKLSDFDDTKTLRDDFLRSHEYRVRNANVLTGNALTGNEPPMYIQHECSSKELQRMFERVQEAWRHLGKADPLWSVLVSNRYRAQNDERLLHEFFETGRHNVELLQATLARNGIDYRQFPEILEFGCGLGRVTRWLAEAGTLVTACDISKPHLDLAARYAKPKHNIVWKLLQSLQSLKTLPRVDLIYSVIVLQHNPPPLIAALLRALLRALKPGGVALFQVPTYKAGYRFINAEYLEAMPNNAMEMHVLAQSTIFGIVQKEGCEMLEVLEDGWTGNRSKEMSNTFLVQKVK